jgi:hypothetical protein
VNARRTNAQQGRVGSASRGGARGDGGRRSQREKGGAARGGRSP